MLIHRTALLLPIFFFFLLKIYYKKTQLGEGRLSLSVLRAGERGSRGPEEGPAA